MPIRFRCVYCDKLLGIARRKAASVVNCPQCKQPLIVPTPEPEPEATAAAASSSTSPPPIGGKLFERDDFDELLQGGATIRTPEEYRRRKRSKGSRSGVQAPLPPKQFPVERSLPPPPPLPGTMPAPPLAAPAGIVLSTGKIILLVAVVLILTGVAFGTGILVGRVLAAP